MRPAGQHQYSQQSMGTHGVLLIVVRDVCGDLQVCLGVAKQVEDLEVDVSGVCCNAS